VLDSKAFVRDLHGFLNTYSSLKEVPLEDVVIFDEAQRAWDEEHVKALSILN